MRILYSPVYSVANIDVCPRFHWARDFFGQLVRFDEKCFVYFPVPFEFAERNDVLRGLVHPRIKIIALDYTVRNQVREMSCSIPQLNDLFNEIDGDYFIDIVINSSLAGMQDIKLGICAPYRPSRSGIGFVTVMQYVLDRKTFSMLDTFYVMAEVMGLYHSDMIIWVNPDQKNRMMKDALSLLSPAAVKRIEESSSFGYVACDFDKLDKIVIAKQAKPGRLCFPFATTSGYKTEEVMDILDSVYKTGRDVKIQVNTSSLASLSLDAIRRDYPHAEITQQLPVEDWYAELAKAHAFVFWCDYAELAHSVMEAQMMEQVGVFKDRPNIYDQLYEGYPFIAKGKIEAVAMLNKIIDNYFSPEIQEVIAKQKKFIREKFDPVRINLSIFEKLRKLYDKIKQPERIQEGRVKLMEDLFSSDKKIGVQEWAARIFHNTRNKVNVLAPNGKFLTGKNYWRDGMLRAGFEDDCQTDQPVFVRK
jgi:hypothetical protein